MYLPKYSWMKYQFGRGVRLDSSENMLQSNSENIKMSTSLQSSLWNTREDIVVQLDSFVVMLFPFPSSHSPLIVVCIILLNLHHGVKCSYSIIHTQLSRSVWLWHWFQPCSRNMALLRALSTLWQAYLSLSNTCCRKGSSLSENVFRVLKSMCWKTLVSSIFGPLNTRLPSSNAAVPCLVL